MTNAPLHEQTLDFIARKEAAGLLSSGAGIAVSVVKDGDVLFCHGYGLRERDRGLPVTPDTIFELGSLTKAFTVALLLMAREEGRLDFDRPLNAPKDVLGLSDREVSQQLSIADVLAHRAGLPANNLLWYFGPARDEALRRAVGRLALAPGAFRKIFIYNNMLYGLLGDAFPEVLGESWAAALERKLLAPLGMTSASLRPAAHEENVALPYVGFRRVPRVDTEAIAAAGALRASLEDVTRWVSFLLAGGKIASGARLLSESSIELMQSKQMAIDAPDPIVLQGFEWLGPSVDYGFGWFLGAARGSKVVCHPGLIDGFSTAIVLVPEKRLGFTVLTNVNLSPAPGLLVQELLTSLLGQDEAGDHPVAKPTLSWTELELIGDYESPAYGTVSVTASGEHLVLRYNGHEWPLSWKSEREAAFTMTAFGIDIPLPVTFEVDGGRARALSILFSLDPRAGPEVFSRSLD